MSKENNIKKGLLAEKMSSFSVEPPTEVWENISSQVKGGRPRRFLFIGLAAAAGLALAITVGVNMLQQESVDAEKTHAKAIEDNSEGIIEDIQEITSEESYELALEPEAAEYNRPSRFEEKVLAALEEVKEEISPEHSKEIERDVVAENIRQIGDAHETDVEQTDVESNDGIEISQIDLDVHKADTESVDTEGAAFESIDVEEKVIDSISSARIMDSIANSVLPEQDLINDVPDEKSKWQIGASLSPIFSYRDASSPDIMQNEAVNSSETGLLSYSGGVQISYLSSGRLTIESGLYYNKMGLAIGNFTSFLSNLDFVVGTETYNDNSIVSLSNSIGTISSDNEDVFANAYAGTKSNFDSELSTQDIVLRNETVNSFVQSLEYLEIPFNLKYKLVDRNFKLLLIGGISTNLLIGNNVAGNTDNGKIDYGSVQDIRSVNYSGNAGLGFVYSISENLSLNLEPRFRYYLNSVNTSDLPATRPYVLGLYTGVNYSF